jgi:hypothetical protein
MTTEFESILYSLSFARLKVTYELITDCWLPTYKGSTLRGAFGDALRRTVCRFPKEKHCSNCQLFTSCLFSRFHENALPPQHPYAGKYPKLPQPYVIEPDLDANTNYLKGATLSFGLVLIGSAIEYTPTILHALFEMGRIGIGSSRCPLQLKQVQCMAADGSLHPLTVGQAPLTFGLHSLKKPWPVNRAVLHFETPVYIKINNQQEARPGEPAFFHALINRLSLLAVSYAGCEWPRLFPYKAMEGLPACLADFTERVDWERVSARQRMRMTFGGFVGRVEIETDSPLWQAALTIGQVAHVGGQTTFGQGKYIVQPMV